LAGKELLRMTRAVTTPTEPIPAPARSARPDAGLLAALVSAAAFGTAGPFAKALLASGWTAGSVVLLRVGTAALILLIPALLACRGRWHLVRSGLGTIAIFGLAAVAGCQVAFVNAVEHLSVGVALLLEYLAVILVSLWAWLRTGAAPTGLTWAGMVASVAGLVLVLDLAGQSPPELVGVAWGLLAAVGLAAYFITASRTDGGLPPIALAAFGMVLGAVALGLLGLLGVVPMTFSTQPVRIGGTTIPSWLALAELAVIAAAAAYLFGTVAARRLGSTVASFVGLTEVLFAVLFAWLLLGELPATIQLAGGALIVVGVIAVRAGERR
jgi:drug/metabolite transporter (DMT)-like permease